MSNKLRPGGQVYSPQQYHLWAKQRFLGCTDYTVPGGKVLTLPNSSADLDTAEFNDFMTAVEAFANEQGCYLDE